MLSSVVSIPFRASQTTCYGVCIFDHSSFAHISMSMFSHRFHLLSRWILFSLVRFFFLTCSLSLSLSLFISLCNCGSHYFVAFFPLNMFSICSFMNHPLTVLRLRNLHAEYICVACVYGFKSKRAGAQAFFYYLTTHNIPDERYSCICNTYVFISSALFVVSVPLFSFSFPNFIGFFLLRFVCFFFVKYTHQIESNVPCYS